MGSAKKRMRAALALGRIALVVALLITLAAAIAEGTGEIESESTQATATQTVTETESTTEEITEEPATTEAPTTTIPPPVIHGVREIHVGRYGAVAYRAGVSVTDSAGQAELTIDSSRVNTDVPGEYKVVYIAASTSGRETRVTARVVVSGVTEEAVAELAAPVLEQLIREDMDGEQKARAVFDWIRTNIRYNAGGERDGALDAAHRGITLRQGDCYTFFALAKVMLEQAGIETIGLERVPARTEHFWLLVNIDGAWYHLDPTPLLHPAPNEGFLMTEGQIADYDPFDWGFYYKYDPAQLPEGVKPAA